MKKDSLLFLNALVEKGYIRYEEVDKIVSRVGSSADLIEVAQGALEYVIETQNTDGAQANQLLEEFQQIMEYATTQDRNNVIPLMGSPESPQCNKQGNEPSRTTNNESAESISKLETPAFLMKNSFLGIALAGAVLGTLINIIAPICYGQLADNFIPTLIVEIVFIFLCIWGIYRFDSFLLKEQKTQGIKKNNIGTAVPGKNLMRYGTGINLLIIIIGSIFIPVGLFSLIGPMGIVLAAVFSPLILGCIYFGSRFNNLYRNNVKLLGWKTSDKLWVGCFVLMGLGSFIVMPFEETFSFPNNIIRIAIIDGILLFYSSYLIKGYEVLSIKIGSDTGNFCSITDISQKAKKLNKLIWLLGMGIIILLQLPVCIAKLPKEEHREVTGTQAASSQNVTTDNNDASLPRESVQTKVPDFTVERVPQSAVASKSPMDNKDGSVKSTNAEDKEIVAAEQGDAEAQYNLGVRYNKGDGIEKNLRKATEWWQKAAEQGHVNAQYNLGICYKNGDGVEEDAVKAAMWFQKAAAQGDANAQYNLGICYKNGDGVEEDAVKAAMWFQKAAVQGDVDAQCNLGMSYKNGDGVEKDLVKAATWFHKAATQGDATAQCNLGVCYYNGDGVEKDLVKAVMWFQKAAAQGYATAQCNLGVCYKNGYGVGKDLVKAAEWFQKAADQGDKSAIKSYATVTEVLRKIKQPSKRIETKLTSLPVVFLKTQSQCDSILGQSDETGELGKCPIKVYQKDGVKIVVIFYDGTAEFVRYVANEKWSDEEAKNFLSKNAFADTSFRQRNDDSSISLLISDKTDNPHVLNDAQGRFLSSIKDNELLIFTARLIKIVQEAEKKGKEEKATQTLNLPPVFLKTMEQCNSQFGSPLTTEKLEDCIVKTHQKDSVKIVTFYRDGKAEIVMYVFPEELSDSDALLLLKKNALPNTTFKAQKEGDGYYFLLFDNKTEETFKPSNYQGICRAKRYEKALIFYTKRMEKILQQISEEK